MGYFITSGNVYYEGERIAPEHIEVPERPSMNHDWIDGAWVYTEPAAPQPVYPTETIMQDVDTGEPVKVIVKSGQVYVGGIEDETPSE